MAFKYKVGDKIKLLYYVSIDGEGFYEGSIGTIKVIDESISFEDSGNETEPAYGISWEGWSGGHALNQEIKDWSGWWLPIEVIDRGSVFCDIQMEFDFEV